MNWVTMNWRRSEYYTQATDALIYGEFIDENLEYLPVFQLGNWIIERSDIAICDAIEEDDMVLKQAAIACFKEAIFKYTGMAEYHLQNTVGAFSYSGILDAEDSEILELWKSIDSYLSDNNQFPWLQKLARTLLVDPDFADKVEASRIYAERGMDRDEIIYSIESSYSALETKISNAHSLIKLKII